ncbi:MAG: hypothetical protein M3Y37_07675 [Chloroflexota bacterium]|nr:hypothetical protein [Chloroflexota bacterium]
MNSVRIVQVGLGTIGGEVVRQILANRSRWASEGLDVGVAAVVTTRCAIHAGGEPIAEDLLARLVDSRVAGESLRNAAESLGLTVVDRANFDLSPLDTERPIVLDAAAGAETARIGVSALQVGGRAIYSNKAPMALDKADQSAQRLWAGARTGHVRYETTCGAGLPVISTLASLLDTGDRVIEITGCLSGTLGAIFSDIAAGSPFSQAIAAAKEAGYTEPDPRDDLSGLDVARKALILARTIGRDVDMADVTVESLVPESLADCSVSSFLERIADHNGALADRNAEAQSGGKALKYVAIVPADGPIRVGMQAVDTSTVLGALQGPENIIAIRTERYDRYPLTISGPGAGAQVTAAGMIADLLQIAKAG